MQDSRPARPSPAARPIFRITRDRSPFRRTHASSQWTAQEHLRCLEGLKQYGTQWKFVQRQVATKSLVQTRAYARTLARELRKISARRPLRLECLRGPRRVEGMRKGACCGLRDVWSVQDGELDRSISPPRKRLDCGSDPGQEVSLGIDVVPEAHDSQGRMESTSNNNKIKMPQCGPRKEKARSKKLRKESRPVPVITQERRPPETALPMQPRFQFAPAEPTTHPDRIADIFTELVSVYQGLMSDLPVCQAQFAADPQISYYWNMLQNFSVSLQHLVNDVSYTRVSPTPSAATQVMLPEPFAFQVPIPAQAVQPVPTQYAYAAAYPAATVAALRPNYIPY